VALVALQSKPGSSLKFGTDLWLSHDTSIEVVRDTDNEGEQAAERLIQISAKLKPTKPIAVFRFCAGKAMFFEAMTASVDEVFDGSLSVARIKEPIAPCIYGATRYGRIISLSSWLMRWQCQTYSPCVGSKLYRFCPA
jgi:hypothetical protein